jgi:RNA polymerase sigma-70 factor (ECF subfamily)
VNEAVAGTVERTSTRPLPTESATAPALDEASRAWLRDLRAAGPLYDAAVARLHELLLRAARHEVRRRVGMVPFLRGEQLDEIALEAADDALVAVLARLDSFRGASRFTTWAYKFALFEAAVKMRKRAWQRREVPLEPETWSLFPSAQPGPAAAAEQAELLAALREALDHLSPHQRSVFAALALNGVPIDVLADRLGTTRGALYKTLHDARRKLRAQLEAGGFATLVSFEEEG